MYTGGVHNRRKRAIERLEAQLKKGTKPVRTELKGLVADRVLEDKDITRIKKELAILKSRV